MRPARTSYIGFYLVLTMLALCAALPSHAASFDCARAKRKIERRICADTTLSRLDDDAAREYAAAYTSATVAHQQDLIAERARFRRERGRYDLSNTGLTADFNDYLRYLRHPLRANLGAYERFDGAALRILLSQTDALILQGNGPNGRATWMTTAPRSAPDKALEVVIDLEPPVSGLSTCTLRLGLEPGTIIAEVNDACTFFGLQGRYTKIVPNLPIWVLPKGAIPQP